MQYVSFDNTTATFLKVNIQAHMYMTFCDVCKQT